MDGSYIRELYPNLCSASFVIKCKKRTGVIDWFILRGIVSSKRVQRGTAWLNGHSFDPAERRHGT
jgi:hypothetical protein